MISIFKTRKQLKKVDFFIIGGQKCGTTSLHHYLSQHPKLNGSISKEVDFFSYEALLNKGENWYLSNFKNHTNNQLLFESSPEYCFIPNVPERIQRYNENAKFIFLVRNPIDRAISAYEMYHKLNSGDLWSSQYLQKLNDHSIHCRKAMIDLLTKKPFPSLKQIIELEIDHYTKDGWGNFLYEPSIIHRGIYFEQLKKYLRIFKRENILIIDFSRLENNLNDVLSSIEDFLKIEKFNWNDLRLERLLAGNYSKDQFKEEMNIMADFFIPLNEDFEKLSGLSFNWNSIIL